MDKAEWLKYILIKQLSASLTEQESRDLNAWLEENPGNKEMFSELNHEPLGPAFEVFEKESGWPLVANRLFGHPTEGKRLMRLRLLVAAIVIGIVGCLVMFAQIVWRHKPANPVLAFVIDTASLAQASELTFGDTSLRLDSLKMDHPVYVVGCTIMRKGSNEIEIQNQQKNCLEDFGVLKTSAHSLWKLHLPDGSLAWINKGSVLRFPLHYGKIRSLHVKGEAYFEVAKAKADTGLIPFIVTLPDSMRVEVMGTRFNVSADLDVKANTTLLEGKIAVYNKKNQRAVLKPGQSAVQDASSLRIEKADTTLVKNWINVYSCSQCDLKELMFAISELYDVNVFVEPGCESVDCRLNGGIDGKLPLNLLLERIEKIFERANLHFEILNNCVYVTRRTNKSNSRRK